MYDLVHRYSPETQARWVPRHEVKSVPKEGDDLKLANMEVRKSYLPLNVFPFVSVCSSSSSSSSGSSISSSGIKS